MEAMTLAREFHLADESDVADIPLLKAVEAYENEHLVYRLQSKLGLERGAAEQLFLDTKRFLFICARRPNEGPFSPSVAIDEGWHQFLMFTKDYQAFCSIFFGKFLHHFPFIPGVPVKPGGVHRAFVIAREMFGSDLSANWMDEVTCDSLSNCSCGGSCGGGCNG